MLRILRSIWSFREKACISDEQELLIDSELKDSLGFHLLKNQCKTRSDVWLKKLGFSAVLKRISVVHKDEEESASRAGPLSSIDDSMLSAVSDMDSYGINFSFRITSIKWQAALQEEADVTARDALCHATDQ